MENQNYNLRYLPLFEDDLNQIINYIAFNLQNPQAANELIDEVENAIFKRLDTPKSFEEFHSKHDRKHPYYRIFVKNFVIYYVIIEDEKQPIMEIRRILYNKRDTTKQI